MFRGGQEPKNNPLPLSTGRTGAAVWSNVALHMGPRGGDVVFTKNVFSLSARLSCDTPSAFFFSQFTNSYSLADKVSYNAADLILLTTGKQFDPLLFFPTPRYQVLLANYYSVPLTVIPIAINYSCTLCRTPFMRPPDHQAKP